MSLTKGTRLGAYEISGQIGAGGMGEVYRATDTKLGREVAIKTLPVALASDKDQLARFEREAKLLAALNHPHIASVYSLDEHEGTLYLAMELVEGETLEEKLKAGAMAVEDALRLALQMAEALEAAHGKGVVHRDLKPANVMVTKDGIVKVLDFGLAKAFSEDPDESNVAQSPALSVAMTQQGLILGTAGYMSPEQASGQPTDQRADIWAFGVVLYEMLTGLPLFSGESVPHILADVLKTEPDWERLPAKLHPRLRLMLERCLTKKPRNRYHSIADARVDIQEVLSDPEGIVAGLGVAGALPGPSLLRRAGFAVGLMGLAAAVAGSAVWYLGLPEPQLVERFDYALPGDIEFRNTSRNNLAISRNGHHFVLRTNNGLYLRPMSELDAQFIPGTDEGREIYSPFFSPDGQRVAYHIGSGDAGEVKTISISGGAPVTVASGLGRLSGAYWADDGMMYLAVPEGIVRLSANGNEEPTLIIPAADGEQLDGPQLLPGGDLVLFTAGRSNDWEQAEIVVYSLETGERTVIYTGGADARYVRTGHLVYAYEDDLFGMPFDMDTLAVGDRVWLVRGLTRAGAAGGSGTGNFDISSDGTLIYLTGVTNRATQLSNNLVWKDRAGGETVIGEPCSCQEIALDTDGVRIAVREVNIERGDSDLWIWSLDSPVRRRQLTFSDGDERTPVWSLDGSRVVYLASGEGIATRTADGAGSAQVLLATPSGANPESIDSEGNVILFRDTGLYVLDSETGEQQPLFDEEFLALSPELSPDGRWLAFASNRTGIREIWVSPYPDSDGTMYKISDGGGRFPKWSADSHLYFFSGTHLMETEIQTESEFSFTSPTALFEREPYGNSYAVSADGNRFLMIKRQQSRADPFEQQPRVNIVKNWFEELKLRAPVD